MARRQAVALVVILLTVTWAGCIGGDEPIQTKADDGKAADAVATSKTGSITGQVVTQDLEILVGVEVALTNRTGGITLTKTDNEGRYTFNDIAPGPYRVAMTDSCCKILAKNVHVVAGNVAELNLRVEKLTDVDKRLPFVNRLEWEGLLACGWSVGGQSGSQCGSSDPNQALEHQFNVTEGIQEMVVGMDWDPVATSTNGELRFILHLQTRIRSSLFITAGQPPLVEHVSDATANRDDVRFSLINGTMDLQYSVANGGIGATYQQPFHVYWYEFYNHGAPPGFNPLPDS